MTVSLHFELPRPVNRDNQPSNRCGEEKTKRGLLVAIYRVYLSPHVTLLGASLLGRDSPSLVFLLL